MKRISLIIILIISFFFIFITSSCDEVKDITNKEDEQTETNDENKEPEVEHHSTGDLPWV